MHSKEPGPGTTSQAYDVMLPEWRKMRAVLGGTQAMRDAGEEMMPRHERESVTAYQERLNTNVLFNLTRITLDEWVGRPFSDPVVLGDGVRKDIADDIDLEGNNISVFSRNWFREGIAGSFAHVIVDMPVLPERSDGQPRTQEDDRRENLRPYWVFLPPENLIFARADVVNGREVLTHARVLEEEVVPAGFGETIRRRIKVYEPGSLRIFEERVVGKSKKVEWVEIEQRILGLPVVPIVTFYADRTGFMVGRSPLSDLADLNIRHWQSQGDQNAILTTTRFAMLASSGEYTAPPTSDGSEPTLVVGPRTWLHMDDPAGKFYYVEHSGKAIEAGRQDLVDLEDKMSAYGAQFLRKRPGSETATARALDSAEATSPLQDVTMRFMDAMNQALAITAAWLKIDPEGWTATLTTDFGPEISDPNDIIALGKAREIRDISRRTHLTELKRRGILGDEFDEEEDAREIEAESMGGRGGVPTSGGAIDPFAAS